MDIFGTRWRIVERRRYPNSTDISTDWEVQHKFLGLFWTKFLQEFMGGNEFSEFYENFKSEKRATKALIEKLGEKRFFKELNEGKIEICRLKPIEFGTRIVEVQIPGMRGFILKSGHYENNRLFVVHNDASRFTESLSKLLMEADLKGIKIDNRRQYDKNHKIEDIDDGVLLI